MKKIVFLLLLGFHTVWAQKYFGISGEKFGTSKVQKKVMNWKTVRSNNFEFNFYKGGEDISRRSIYRIENEYSRITEILGYTPFSIMKVFVYNNPSDLEESNIGLSSQTEIDKKNINLSKARIQIAYNKNDSLFYQSLIKEVSTLFVYDMLYGGSLKESMQSQLLLSLPDWFIKGIASYIAHPENNLDQAQLKTLLLEPNSRRVNHFMNQEAEIIGESIWRYIALKYGRDNISNILNLTRIIRNEQSSITSTLGISYLKFIKDWRNYYLVGPKSTTDENTPSTLNISDQKTFEPKSSETEILNLKPGEIDTENYKFDPENVTAYAALKREISNKPGGSEKQEGLSVLSNGLRRKQEIKIGPTKTYNNFLVSNANAVFLAMDPVRRFGLGYNASFNDLLENNVVTANIFLKLSSPFIKNYDYTLSYGNYSRKIDFLFKFTKRSYNIEGIDNTNDFLFRPLNIFPLDNRIVSISRRISSQKLSVEFIYPLPKNISVRLSPAFFKSSDLDYELPGKKTLTDNYFNPNFQLVFDNSKVMSATVDLGTKAKLELDRYYEISNSIKNFERINLDARHTQKILKGFLIEGRYNLTLSRGRSPKFSMLGGVENWINRTVQDAGNQIPGPEGDYRDILFYNFPGQLRGFQMGRLFGTSHMLANLEARLVMSEYFPSSSISSTFLRNLQLVGFYDTGTAWKGSKGPFSKQNSLNTTLIGNDGKSPFFAEVTNFKNPFLQGFGLGIRTSLLGYIVKADYAWGLEDKEIFKPRLYISLGRDF
jgi:hypothetical protein